MTHRLPPGVQHATYLVLLIRALTGCASGATCDSTSILVDDVCVLENSMPAPDAGHDAALHDGSDSGADDASSAPDTYLGLPCSDDATHAECGSDAPYCAKMPGQAMGVCTIAGCADPGGSCPDGWSCLNLSFFDPDLPSVCVQ